MTKAAAMTATTATDPARPNPFMTPAALLSEAGTSAGGDAGGSTIGGGAGGDMLLWVGAGTVAGGLSEGEGAGAGGLPEGAGAGVGAFGETAGDGEVVGE